ncbi:MAG: alanine--tRNA ligase [Clostridia bacterium]|nr:MAG: alanine--tRNA ligase [Clostridia bacterium]
MTGNELRTRFLTYFSRHGHAVVPSSSLVPAHDPTLLFTNAGMVQFKEVFLGLEKKPYRRATTVQKCVRAGGKHNDLETVGRTARHHTFFEMLGNFSFGDYFKAEATEFAWRFLVDELSLPRERLWVTVYQGDEQAYQLWQKIAPLDAGRIVRMGEKDNFWAMAETGPCGPCSEIIYDRGSQYSCGPDCGIGRCDCDRWLEIWNLVFMQYDRDPEGRLTPLPRPSIDTGMGLERIASVMQGKDSNFETDLIFPLIRWLEEMTGKPYEAGAGGFPFRVVADHARASTFLVADGVMPANEGRGYVLRRILRRAVRLGRSLEMEPPFLHRMVEPVVASMGTAYPELREQMRQVQAVIREEEERFYQTLEEGMKVAQKLLVQCRSQGGRHLPGDQAFLLYDTYGFPLDLTRDMAVEHGLAVDEEGFQQALEEQRRRARQAREIARSGELQDAAVSSLLADLPPTTFVGYEATRTKTSLQAMVLSGKLVDQAGAGESVALVLAQTPCYPEGGGQVADSGFLHSGTGEAAITAARRLPSGQIVHLAKVEAGFLRVDQEVEVAVEQRRRERTARHHSATHLLHRSLQAVLGPQARQAGSLVTPDRLRFDFHHSTPLTPEQLRQVEGLVNENILADLPVVAGERPRAEALGMGAMALFGEKYGETVRVVSMGDFSHELCGGTHVRSTGQIGAFKIISEGSVGSGLRRIEAVAGEATLAYLAQIESALLEVASLLRTTPPEVPSRITALLQELKQAQRERENYQAKLAGAQVSEALATVQDVGGVKVLAQMVKAETPQALRAMADVIRDRLGSGVVVLGSAMDGHVNLVAMITGDLVARGLHAGRLIQEVSQVAGGKGGGRPEMAQGGGPNPEKLEQALQRALEVVARQVS